MAARPVLQPPFTAELLADLHAGNVAPEVADELWAAAQRDPAAREYLAALDDVSTRLRGLSTETDVMHPMPADVMTRLDAFIDGLDPAEIGSEDDAAAPITPTPPEFRSTPMPSTAGSPPEVSPPAPVSLAARRKARWQWLAAAAAAVVIVAAAGVTFNTLRSGDEAAPTAKPTAGVVQLDENLDANTILSTFGRNDVSGRLAAPEALQSCVQANGLSRSILGSSDIRFRGSAAVLILLSGPHSPQITALVVGSGCTAADPQHLAIKDIG